MIWTDAEAAIVAQIEAQWPSTAYAAMPLVFENENALYETNYVAIFVEGVYTDKTIYGSVGKRLSIEAGIVFFHVFVPTGSGRAAALGAVQAMTAILELQTIGDGIKMEGGTPPTPVEYHMEFDRALARSEPGGNYYRCSGSVPFIVIDTR